LFSAVLPGHTLGQLITEIATETGQVVPASGAIHAGPDIARAPVGPHRHRHIPAAPTGALLDLGARSGTPCQRCIGGDDLDRHAGMRISVH